jgi:hypothetical protein
MSKLVFIADDRITDIPDAQDNPDLIQVTGAAKDTNLQVLSVKLKSGNVSGNIDPTRKSGVVFAPKTQFEQLRDCFDHFLIKIEMDYDQNGGNYSITSITSTL